MSDPITHTIDRLQRFAAVRGNKRALARAANLAESTLIGLEAPDWNPKAETLAALAKALEQLEGGKAKRARAPFQHVA